MKKIPNRIPDEVLAQVMSDHETRINALSAQQVHLAIMVEYLVDLLTQTVSDFEIDNEEFIEFRNKRFNEMKSEAIEISKARNASITASKEIREGNQPVELDLDETSNFGHSDG